MAGTLNEQLSKIEISCFYNSTAVTNERSINITLFSNRCAAEFITETTVFTCSRTSASRRTSLVSIMQALSFRSLGVPARLLAIRADLMLSDSVDLVPVFTFQEPRGSGVDEALVVWSLGDE